MNETRQQPVAAPANPEPTGARMPDAPAAPDSDAIATRAREAERDRVSTIYDLAGRLNLERGFAEDLVKRGVSVDESRRLILDQVAAKSDETRTFPMSRCPSAAGTSASPAATPWRTRSCTATVRRSSRWKTPPASTAA
ncbi:hypothetical protein V6L77_01755 [Pannonibacter sp. Pt2-lr]